MTRMSKVWHRTFCASYDHKQDGHRYRAGIYGWIADRLVRFA